MRRVDGDGDRCKVQRGNLVAGVHRHGGSTGFAPPTLGQHRNRLDRHKYSSQNQRRNRQEISHGSVFGIESFFPADHKAEIADVILRFGGQRKQKSKWNARATIQP